MPDLAEPPAVAAVQRNEFAYLQREIARRADQLARQVISDCATDVFLWLQAEEEVFARHGGETPRWRPE